MFLWEYTINFINFLFFYILLEHKTKMRDIFHKRIFNIFLIFVFSACFLLANMFLFSYRWRPIASFIIFYLFALSLTADTQFTRVIWSIIYLAVNIISRALSIFVQTSIFKINYATMMKSNPDQIILSLVFITLTAVQTTMILFYSSSEILLTNKEKWISALIFLLCLSAEEIIVAAITYDMADRTSLLYVAFFLVMTLCVLSMYGLYNLGIQREKNKKLQEIQLASSLEQEHYQNLMHTTAELREMRHDAKNYLAVLRSLISAGKTKEAEEYLDSFTQFYDAQPPLLATGNLVLDSIITEKLMICRKEKIQVDYTIHFPADCPLTDLELCSLIGNLFDNAIEAVRKIPGKGRNISFNIKPYKNMFSLFISNTYSGVYLLQDGVLQTTKSSGDTESHGLGLKRVQDMITKYNGFLKIDPGEKKFTVNIMIPLRESGAAE